jgi:glyceraldehyde 3-phosphate dehydrogenase
MPRLPRIYSKYDSTFGRYKGTVEAEGDEIVIDGRKVKILSVKDPSNLPWKQLMIDLVIESTGKFSEAKEAMKHITAGARR